MDLLSLPIEGESLPMELLPLPIQGESLRMELLPLPIHGASLPMELLRLPIQGESLRMELLRLPMEEEPLPMDLLSLPLEVEPRPPGRIALGTTPSRPILTPILTPIVALSAPLVLTAPALGRRPRRSSGSRPSGPGMACPPWPPTACDGTTPSCTGPSGLRRPMACGTARLGQGRAAGPGIAGRRRRADPQWQQHDVVRDHLGGPGRRHRPAQRRQRGRPGRPGGPAATDAAVGIAMRALRDEAASGHGRQPGPQQGEDEPGQ